MINILIYILSQNKITNFCCDIFSSKFQNEKIKILYLCWLHVSLFIQMFISRRRKKYSSFQKETFINIMQINWRRCSLYKQKFNMRMNLTLELVIH